MVRRCCSASRPPAGAAPRDAKRALARALVERFHGADAAAARPRSTSTACTSTHELPDEIDELALSPANGDRSTCRRLIADGVRRARARRRGGCSPRAACSSTASRCGATSSTSPRERLDGARAAGRQAPVPPPARRADGRPRRAAAAADRGRRRDRRPHRRRARERVDAGSRSADALVAAPRCRDAASSWRSRPRAGAITASVLPAERLCCRLSAPRREGIPFPSRARRSLKTQQHAHLRVDLLDPVCVQVRSAGSQPGSADLRMTRHRPRRHGVLGAAQ